MKLTTKISNQCKDLLKLLEEQKQIDKQFREAIINYQIKQHEKESSPKL